MKRILISLIFFFVYTLHADNTEAEKIAKQFLTSLNSDNSDELLKMFITVEHIKKKFENPAGPGPVPPKEMIPKILKPFEEAESKNKERIPRFLEEFKKLENFKYKEVEGDARKTPRGQVIQSLRLIFESKEKDSFSLDLGTAVEIEGQWFIKDFPDSIFIKRMNQTPLCIGFESKNNAIQTSMNSFSEITNGAMGSQLISIVCLSCGPAGFEEKFKKISFEEKHLKGGILGLPWRALTEKQALKREELKLKSVKDINETEIIATFASTSHEISGPMVLEHGRWLFTMGKAEVYLLKDGKKTLVDLSSL